MVRIFYVNKRKYTKINKGKLEPKLTNKQKVTDNRNKHTISFDKTYY